MTTEPPKVNPRMTPKYQSDKMTTKPAPVFLQRKYQNCQLWKNKDKPEVGLWIILLSLFTHAIQGLKANMKRLYHLVTDAQFNRCKKPEKYKKLLFSLCFFHSVLLERKKFLQLGWNVSYSFNDSDFEVGLGLQIRLDMFLGVGVSVFVWLRGGGECLFVWQLSIQSLVWFVNLAVGHINGI